MRPHPLRTLLAARHVLGAIFLLLLAACGGPSEPPPEQLSAGASQEVHDGPNILFVSLDTLRADHLGSYGATGDPTPRLDALAAAGVRFAAASCPMPVTRPSHFTMLTSRYPRDHGSLSNASPLPEGVRTVTEELAEAGYRTAAFTGVKLLAPGSGADRGFQVFEAPDRGEDRSAEEVVTAAERWLGEQTGAAPFFLWVHMYDPHMPYAPPAPYAVAPPVGLEEELPYFSRPLLKPLLERTDGDVPREVLDWALAQYDGEVRYVDHWVGRLLDRLEAAGMSEETLVVVTSDHGECFSNGIYFEHGTCLYEGALHVPLILRLPATASGRWAPGEVVDRPVDLLALAPTMLEVAGLPVPEDFGGTSLLAPPPEDSTRDSAAYFQNPRYDSGARERRMERRERLSSVAGDELRPVFEGEVVGVRTGRWKLIVGQHGLQKLFDLEADPAELQDVSAEHPEVLDDLRRRIKAWIVAHPVAEGGPEEIDEELEKTLRSLGY
ncbi:MAG: sulfatase [Acidobacteriota bacterium]|nr:sulfatase [Acidobacteriota bacterium]